MNFKGVEEIYTAPNWSGGDFKPPADNTYLLGDATYSWKEVHVETVVYATSVVGNWSPSADDTYWLGTATYGWKGMHMPDTLITDDTGVVKIRNNANTADLSLTALNLTLSGTTTALTFSGAATVVAGSGLTMPAFTAGGIITVADTMAINTGVANDDYFTIGAVDNDDNLIDELMRFVGSATPHVQLTLGDLRSANAITIRPSGDTDDYFTIATVSGIPTIYGTGSYVRIGDARTASSASTEDDLLVTGVMETAYLYVAITSSFYSTVTIRDNIYFNIGQTSDTTLFHKSSSTSANAAISNILEGTPVTPATSANTFYFSHMTNDTDMLFASSRGGNSEAFLFMDGSAGDLHLYYQGLERILLDSNGIVLNSVILINDTFGINTGVADDDYFTIGADDTGVGIVEVARAQGAADPYFSMGGSQEFKFYTSGYVAISGSVANHIYISGAATSSQLYIGGSAILASGEQAIYINCPSETVPTNGIWVTLKSTTTSGDLTGIRARAYGNAASAGASVRGGYLEAKMEASKYAAMLEGVLSHADYSAGSITVSGDVRGLTSHISQGASLNAANLYGILVSIQTRGDETITTDDVGLCIKNEAVGGAGRQMDAAILIKDVNVSANAYGYGIDFGSAKIATGAIRLGDGHDIVLGTATGTKIGTATNQKLGLFNSTPVVQPTGTAVVTENYAGTGDLDTEAELATAINANGAAINLIRTALNALGLTTTV